MKKQNNPKIELMGHSEAKISLYGHYLSIYLQLLSRVPNIDRIFIFDLLCGEGIYQDGSKGSPIIALEAIKNHYYLNNQSCPNINIWFNDNGISLIESGRYKIDRVKSFSSQIFIPPNVNVCFFREDYDCICPKAVDQVKKSDHQKGLFFIDPYGYKDIRPVQIRDIMYGGNTEVLLFLPISHMYRFADSSLRSSYPGNAPLQNFLLELFGNGTPRFQSVYDFITQLKERFRVYLSKQSVFVDTFTLERDSSNIYCLYFFTSHIRGFEKMLEAKWGLDKVSGKGYSLDRSLSFFNEIELTGYRGKLIEYIESADYRTNIEIYRFGLENGFLPKHTKDILESWRKLDNFHVFSLDGKIVRGFYISYNPDRKVGYKFDKL
jgi:three-Cys-motif partner protein